VCQLLHPNLGTGSVHVAAEKASVPTEWSNSSKFLIFAVLSAVRVFIVFIRLENSGADIRGYPHPRKVPITTVFQGGDSTLEITFKVRHLNTHKEYVLWLRTDRQRTNSGNGTLCSCLYSTGTRFESLSRPRLPLQMCKVCSREYRLYTSWYL